MPMENIPNEVLINVFGGLKREYQAECRKVCRRWYLAARHVMLKNIRLRGSNNVDQFIRFLNENHPIASTITYLELGGKLGVEGVDTHQISQLLAILTNIKIISVCGGSTCDRFATYLSLYPDRRPDLQLYMKPSSPENPSYSPYNMYSQPLVQRTLRNAIFENSKFFALIPNFLQLQAAHLCIYSDMNQLFPIFERKTTNLTTFGVSLMGQCRKEFMDEYLEAKSKEGQQQIIHNLAKIENLIIKTQMCITQGFIPCVSRYFTGLKTLWITADIVTTGLNSRKNNAMNF